MNIKEEYDNLVLSKKDNFICKVEEYVAEAIDNYCEDDCEIDTAFKNKMLLEIYNNISKIKNIKTENLNEENLMLIAVLLRASANAVCEKTEN